jgi:hypothetical protein
MQRSIRACAGTDGCAAALIRLLLGRAGGAFALDYGVLVRSTARALALQGRRRCAQGCGRLVCQYSFGHTVGLALQRVVHRTDAQLGLQPCSTKVQGSRAGPCQASFNQLLDTVVAERALQHVSGTWRGLRGCAFSRCGSGGHLGRSTQAAHRQAPPLLLSTSQR